MTINTTLNYSPNFDLKKRKPSRIKFIIFHYTGMKKEIDAMAASSGGRLKVTYVVGKTANDTSGQGGEHGWIDAEKLKRLAFPPSSDSQMWICGTPGFYNSMAGSRMDPLESDSILAKLGYTQDMILRY